MKHTKDTNTTRNDFWLDLGPAADWADMPPEAAARLGDASPDGTLRGFSGAEAGTVYEPSRAENNSGKDHGDRPETPDRHADQGGQTPDVSTGNVPAEMPPVPPETWPGL